MTVRCIPYLTLEQWRALGVSIASAIEIEPGRWLVVATTTARGAELLTSA